MARMTKAARRRRKRRIIRLILILIVIIEGIGLSMLIPKTETWVVEDHQWICYIQINRGENKIPLQAHSSGNGKFPKLPDYSLKKGETVGKKTAIYSVVCKKGDITKDFYFDYDEWMSIETGDKIKVITSKIGGTEIVVERR